MTKCLECLNFSHYQSFMKSVRCTCRYLSVRSWDLYYCSVMAGSTLCMSNVIFQAAISVLAESVVINPRPKECTCTFIGIHVSMSCMEPNQ